MMPKTDQPPQASTLAKTTRATVTIGGGVTTLVALVTDVLAPLGPITLYLAGAVGVLLLICVIPAPKAPRVHALGRAWFKHHWGKPINVGLAVAFVLLLIASRFTGSAPEGGWLAAQIPAVRAVQEKLGVMSTQMQDIAEDTQSIREDTGRMSAKMDRLKQETSDDPRKELANLGVAWSTQSFVEAMMASDERTVKLFLKGGMPATVLHNGASAVLYILQPKLPDAVPVLKLLVEAGFDPDENLIDGRILCHYSESLPPHFESPALPADYAAWQNTFAGPIMLWVAIRAAWAGPTRSDLDVIRFLRDQSADSTLARQFLVAYEPIWGDTESYKQIRKAIF